jgi:hypothetical protein
LEYVDGRYRVFLDHTTAKAEQGSVVLGDFILDVDVTQVGGDTRGTAMGVSFRVQDPENFYSAKISGEGWFTVERNSRARGDMGLDSGAAPPVRPMGQTNHLTVLCRGQEMSFYVNGQLLSTVQDDTFTGGRVAIRGNAPEGQIDIYFDNLYVYALAQ